ncbi:MAG: glycogen debranching protein GlgX, partial [Deltaproteobacteria bacterium]|nr:glycogen debranching protein GlgX [Deltaproteobacteria bacterium]
EKIPYLKQLGITTVELLPIHEFHVEDFLQERGLTNYWGYNTLAFFAPESSYRTGSSPGCQVTELKQLVRALHQAGIEILLDVVYNHTAEGNELGPTFSLKGIDNTVYYFLAGAPGEPGRYYMNCTGCGNSLNLMHPQGIRLVMDSLRYWVEVMHVDGFRFDLASALGREQHGFARTASFFDVVSQDPALQRVKLVAEPWDLDTYQVGNFPVDWSEWNGRFRDTVRRFWQGRSNQVPDLGWRLTGSADLYGDDGRSAFNSVNFVTCHDGFTLWDLVSYDGKHNEANQEGNRDGSDDNVSCSFGVEGPTTDPAVLELRRRQAKNFLCTLLCSLGTPMLLGGDERLRTQQGNNNAYCQDNEISWFDWSEAAPCSEMVEFVRRAIAFNRRYTILHRRKFYSGTDADGNLRPDIAWWGKHRNAPAWGDGELHTLGMMLDGSEEPSELGSYFLFLLYNADRSGQYIELPELPAGMCWRRVVDTSLPPGQDFLEPDEEVPLAPADHYWANGLSSVVLLGR